MDADADDQGSGDALTRLHLLATELGITPADLDELVHEALHENAAATNHGLPGDDIADDEAYTARDDAVSTAASRVNNRGVEAQLAVLLDGATEADVAHQLTATRPTA